MITRHKHYWNADRLASIAAGLPVEYRLPFGASYAYSPKGCAGVSELSRLLCTRVKTADAAWLTCYAARVHDQVREGRCFGEFFSNNAVLIPIPKNGPSAPNTRWIARHLALALRATGLAGSVWPGLLRVMRVKRSSTAWMWERPTVQQHYQSFAVMRARTPPTQIVLIDDVITKGRTLIAAAIRLHETFPHAQIRAFALVRTMGFIPDIERLIDPCQGEIRWNGEDAQRDP